MRASEVVTTGRSPSNSFAVCGVCGGEELDPNRAGRLVCRICGAHHVPARQAIPESLEAWNSILA